MLMQRGQLIIGNDVVIGKDGSIPEGQVKNAYGIAEVTRRLEIGSWDMDATGQVILTHFIPDYTKIIKVFAKVMDDTGVSWYNLVGDNCGYLIWNATTILLNRLGGGTFDNAGFDDTSVNRGYVDIKYEE